MALRDVTVEELFTWTERLGFNAWLAFGKSACVNMKTFADIKSRCDEIERRELHDCQRIPSLNGVTLYVSEEVPDGIIRPSKWVALVKDDYSQPDAE